MTEKRFTLNRVGRERIIDGIIDNKTDELLDNQMDFCEKLNALHEENTYLKLELDTHKHPLWSTREAERKVSELTELLSDEVKKNGELKEENNLLKIEKERLKKDYQRLHQIESRLRVRIKKMEHKEDF